MPDPDAKVHHVPHPTNAPCPWLRKYIADKIDSGSEMPSKPFIAPESLQEVCLKIRGVLTNSFLVDLPVMLVPVRVVNASRSGNSSRGRAARLAVKDHSHG